MSEPVVSQHIELNVKGMTCTNCALGVRKFLEKEGMEEVYVDFSNGEVQFNMPESGRLSPLVKGIERLGFEVSEDGLKEEGWSMVEKLFAVSAVFTIPLILHMFISWHWLHNPWVQLILTIPVYAIGVWHFGRSGWNSLKSGVPNMDVLIIIGATAAVGYSLYGAITAAGPDFLFFETGAAIITLVLLGNVMEHRAVRRTTTAIRELSALQPQTANRIHPQDPSQIESIPLGHVVPGDLLQVNEGDKIPVDGQVRTGSGSVDQSMITGESLPVDLQVKDQVVGGTVLVSGNLTIVAEATGKAGTLSKIIELVKRAQADKPQIQQLADRISAIFVPAVLGISLLTFVLSWLVFGVSLSDSIIHSVAVLVIACPCAMGLATPTAVVVGLGRASKQGILVKGGRTLEVFAGIDTIVFDKTGTLTTGRLTVSDVHVSGISEETAKAVIRSLEQYSSHPIAKALLREFEGADLIPLTNVTETKGLGISGEDAQGTRWQLGSFRIAAGLNDELTHDQYLLKNGELVATLSLEDELREDAKETISWLNGQEIETILLTGDRKEKAAQVADALGIRTVYAEQLPDQKLALISELRKEGEVAMVGDGINDAPALAKASVGISPGGATDIAIQSAEVVLLSGKLSSLKTLHQISRHTVKTIKQNLFWAFFYNTIAIPFAAVGFLKPIIGAATMAISDVLVIGNSLRLKWKSIR